MKHIILFLLLAATAKAQVVNQISNGRLQTTLNGNGQNISNVGRISTGTGTPTSRIHLGPGTSPITPADGIRFGDDVVMYRSANGTLTLNGALAVTGAFTNSGYTVSLASDNAWTGVNSF